MKKVAVAIAYFSISFSTHAQTTPAQLPSDVKIVAPAASLPAQVSAFSGKWAGRWANTNLDHTLVVEDIKAPDDVDIVYATTVANPPSQSWGRFKAKIEGGALLTTVRQGAAKVKYTVMPDGALAGEYVWNNQVTRGTFKKEQ